METEATFAAGLFIRALNVESAIDLLLATGFTKDNISVCFQRDKAIALAESLVAKGIHKPVAKRLGERVGKGGMLVLVRCEDRGRGRQAKQTLLRAGAAETTTTSRGRSTGKR